MKRMFYAAFPITFFFLTTHLFAINTALSSVGAFGASNLCMTFLSIGSIADGHSHKVYEDDTATELLQIIIGLTQNSIVSLQNLLHSGILDEKDFSYVTEMINTLSLLSKEAESYQEYMKTGESRFADIYNNYRNSAWAKIVELLKINE